jgi:AcrR family transcriptional regulator
MTASATVAMSDTRPGYGQGREALLRAVIAVVSSGGLRNLTYRSVAAEAGVTHGLVRHHFGSRDALIEAALDYALELSIANSSLDAQITSIDEFAESLDSLIDLDPELQAFQFELALESRRNPELLPYVAKLYDGYRDATRTALASLGIADSDVADLAFAALDGMAFQQVTFGTSAQTRRGVRALQQLLTAHNPE